MALRYLAALNTAALLFNPFLGIQASLLSQKTIFEQRCYPASKAHLDEPTASAVARAVVSSAENSSLRWEQQVGYLEYNVEHNETENRGYTGGVVGFTSRTHDMLIMVKNYALRRPDSALASFVPALVAVDGSSSQAGLGAPFEAAWRQAAADPEFVAAQLWVADQIYLHPAIVAAQADGLGRLGEMIYYDALVMHGPGSDPASFGGIRSAAKTYAKPPSIGGDEKKYLASFLQVREKAMRAEAAHSDVSRISTEQRRWLSSGNLDLSLPLDWEVYGDRFMIRETSSTSCKKYDPKVKLICDDNTADCGSISV